AGDRDLSTLDGPDANFGPLQILHDADRPPDLLFQRANGGMDACMVLMAAMTEVEAERIDAGKEQRFEHVSRSARRSDGGDNFGPAIAAHWSIGPWAASGDQNRSDIVGAGRPGTDEIAG